MAHLQYMPGDPRLVDQLVYELKSKGIFDQFRKECIADVDTRPAYQNLRQRVENSVSTFLSRQCWKPDLNKNQLREKLRKHILDGNYLEQGVERIVDQVVNPKVASVFIPQVEDLVYNYLGISRKKSVSTAETSNGKVSSDDLLPTDLEAVSPGSVKSNDDQDDRMDTDTLEVVKMDIAEVKDSTEELIPSEILEKPKEDETQITEAIEVILNSDGTTDKSDIPLHTDDIRLENIPAPENSPPKIELESIELPKEPNISKEIPLPDQIPLPQDDGPKDQYFKPVNVNSDDDSSSDSSLRRNMSPLTPIRSYNNENSCDAQQGFDNDSDGKSDEKKTPSTFRFAIDLKSTENSSEAKSDKKTDSLAYQFNNQVNINTFNTPTYEDSSNSNNLRIDYESDANSKFTEKVTETEHNSEDSKKDKKSEDKKSSHKSSHRSRDSHRHSSGKDNRSDSKHSRDNSRHDKKSKDDNSSKSKSSQKESERSRDKSEKKDSRDSSKHSSHKSSSNKDSKSHRSSSSSQKYSSKHSDKKSSSSSKDKEKSSDKSSKERDRKDSKSSSHRSDKDRKSSSSSSKTKHEDKDKKKDKKDADDHYSLSGRGNHTRRSTDRDSNDGSSSSKGSNNQSSSKSTEVKKESKETGSKSDNTSTSGGTTSPSDKEVIMNNASDKHQQKPIRVENHLETPIASPPRLPFVPDVTLKKPKFAANLAEAKKMMRMRKFLDEEQKRMNQEAALLLEFQANVRPSLSQVYSSIPGPELEFACVTNDVNSGHVKNQVFDKEEIVETNVKNESTETNDDKNAEINDNKSENAESTLRNESYNENKPFSQLVNEISERNKNHDVKTENGPDDENENKMRTEYFEVTIITEELSESDEPDTAKNKIESDNSTQDSEHIKPDDKSKHISANLKTDSKNKKQDTKTEKALDNPQEELHYFPEQEKYDAELKRQHQSNLFKSFMDRNSISNKIYLFNCDTYEENILREVSLNFGSYSIINYYRNGHLTLPKPAKNVNVNLATEIALPMDTCDIKDTSHVSSPVKSECSFELSSDYDAKLEEMVNKTSRQEVMEIILGSITDKPTIDYCTEFSVTADASLKRKLIEAESTVNNNRPVLIPKIRKLSESDLISSTTQESEEKSNNNRLANSTRSKYLGRARRVGLPRPKRTNLSNSPSSDKSVENYAQNTPAPPNGKLKSTPRSKVQRYDTSDLYKPKLHYLSRRNNIS